MKADAIIFDKDGTLIDFDAFWVPISVKAIGSVLKRLNMDLAIGERILEAFGVSDGVTSIDGVLCKGTYRQMGEIMRGILCEYGYDGSVDEAVTLLANAYDKSTDAGRIKPTCHKLAEALRELKDRGKHLAVVTTDNEVITRKCLKALGIEELFDKIYTDDGVTPPKPNPFCAIDFCRLCGIEKDRAVMVGDTMTDVKFAKNAEISVLGLAKTDTNRVILEADADAVISKISDLIDIIE